MTHHYSPAGLDTGDAEKTAAILQDRLAALIDLSLVLKHIHWNVTGAGFVAVHELMDAQTLQTRAMLDAAAERISTLGGTPVGLVSQVAKSVSSEDYPLGRASVMDHLRALDQVYARIGEDHRQAIEQVAALDPITEDLLVSQTSELELMHWFIRAHISDPEGHIKTG